MEGGRGFEKRKKEKKDEETSVKNRGRSESGPGPPHCRESMTGVHLGSIIKVPAYSNISHSSQLRSRSSLVAPDLTCSPDGVRWDFDVMQMVPAPDE